MSKMERRCAMEALLIGMRCYDDLTITRRQLSEARAAIECAIPECEAGNWHKARAILEDALDETQ